MTDTAANKAGRNKWRRQWTDPVWGLMRRLLGICLLAIGGVLLLTLISSDPSDPSRLVHVDRAPVNWFGMPGALVSAELRTWIGMPAALVATLAVLAWGWRMVRSRSLGRFGWRLLALALALVLATLTAAWFQPGEGSSSAVLGAAEVVGAFRAQVGTELADTSWFQAIMVTTCMVLATIAWLYASALQASDWAGLVKGVRAFYAAARRLTAGISSDEASAPAQRVAPTLGPTMETPKERPPKKKRRRVQTASPPRVGQREDDERQATLGMDEEGYRLPPLGLLRKPTRAVRGTAEGQEANARMLETVLAEFGIAGVIERILSGPVVTRYDFEPEPGIRSRRVISLAPDIARSMSAQAARVSVVTDRNAIGIELPNAKRETVYLREILGSELFEKQRGSLIIALGKDINGEPVTADLAGMPHLLIAGTTGSGKSVGVNGMVLSLLYRLPPDQLRLIMIDPKMLEFTVYEGIPHLLHPVVTDPKKSVAALRWAVREMNSRYQTMSLLQVRNVEAYNRKVEEAVARGRKLSREVQTGFDAETGKPVYETQTIEPEPFPYLVIVVDEMADLMLSAGKDFELAIQALAQKARAAGIHLVVATQRPSVDVVTGTIKANLPYRISFQVSSATDSRTVLGDQGAEQLLGKGDMLYLQAGGKMQRVHGPFVSDEEVERVADFLRNLGISTEYNLEVTEEVGDAQALDSSEEAGRDALYDDAVALLRQKGKASTSFLQRHLQIGYNRAARMIDQLESDGIVSPADHTGKREVIG